MKTALSIIGIVFLVLLVFLGGFIGVFIYAGAHLDASSKAYVDENVPLIVDHWSKDELIKRESPELRKSVSEEQVNQLFTKLSALGPMKSYDGATGQANMNLKPATGLQLTAVYLAKATFQNGKAEIHVSLIRVNGAWEIFGFHVNLSPTPI